VHKQRSQRLRGVEEQEEKGRDIQQYAKTNGVVQRKRLAAKDQCRYGEEAVPEVSEGNADISAKDPHRGMRARASIPIHEHKQDLDDIGIYTLRILSQH
jgi:hypothetical protein